MARPAAFSGPIARRSTPDAYALPNWLAISLCT
jgi:hypothetical protein